MFPVVSELLLHARRVRSRPPVDHSFRPPHLLQYSYVFAMSQYKPQGRSAGELAADLERAIADGRLLPGEKLPSVRKLAAAAGLSPTTVMAALATLRQRGLVISRPRSHTVISPRPPLSRPWTSPTSGAVRDLASGNPDPALLPDIALYLRRLEPEKALYGAEPMIPELRRLAEAELEAAGIAADHLTVVNGGLDGIERALAAQLQPGDRIAVEDPGYPGVLDLCRSLGLQIVPVPIDSRGMSPAGLESAISAGAVAAVLTPRGQNPTGACLDRERARDLRAVLDRHPDLFVVEDDHLGPISGAERLTVIRDRGRWAATRSVSKSFGPDIRVALLAGDEMTVSRVEGRLMLGPQWVSHLLQALTVALWSDPSLGEEMEHVTEIYRERRSALLEALGEIGIVIEAPTGFNVWIPVPDEAGVATSLFERGWTVTPGSHFRIESDPAIRVTTSTLEPEAGRAFVADLDSVLRPPRRTRTA